MNVSLHSEAATNLALAVVASSSAPLLLLDGECTVIAASESFCLAFQLESADVIGRAVGKLGSGEWSRLQLDALLRATASGTAQVDGYEMDLERKGQGLRQLVLDAHKLDYGNADDVRLLLSIADVTDARLAEKIKDNLVREKSILLQELQHRVANSLQIIASVLLQSARRVQSDETRFHLHNAHNRVMSVAALQQQLAASQLGDVELQTYFTDLCRSIGASMINDHNQLVIDAIVDESIVSADVSVSLGLIVTELVINALKHAFPDHASGTIKVGYRSDGPAWTLSVSDNGMGMPALPQVTHSGLGSSIVDALATKLNARVKIADANPGTTVWVLHA